MNTSSDKASSITKASISIHYCRQCNWMLRS
ncbi:selenoprotein W-like protein, partial [Vibrio sp. 10N.222.54.F6]